MSASFDLGFGSEADPDMVQFLRLSCLKGADTFLLEPVFSNELWGFMSYPVSEENERAVGNLVLSRCRTALATLRAEEADEPSQGLGPAVISVRQGEIRALQATVSWWTRDLELLNLKQYYQERRLKELNLDKEWSPEDGQTESSFSGGRAPGNVDWS